MVTLSVLILSIVLAFLIGVWIGRVSVDRNCACQSFDYAKQIIKNGERDMWKIETKPNTQIAEEYKQMKAMVEWATGCSFDDICADYKQRSQLTKIKDLEKCIEEERQYRLRIEVANTKLRERLGKKWKFEEEQHKEISYLRAKLVRAAELTVQAAGNRCCGSDAFGQIEYTLEPWMPAKERAKRELSRRGEGCDEERLPVNKAPYRMDAPMPGMEPCERHGLNPCGPCAFPELGGAKVEGRALACLEIEQRRKDESLSDARPGYIQGTTVEAVLDTQTLTYRFVRRFLNEKPQGGFTPRTGPSKIDSPAFFSKSDGELKDAIGKLFDAVYSHTLPICDAVEQAVLLAKKDDFYGGPIIVGKKSKVTITRKGKAAVSCPKCKLEHFEWKYKGTGRAKRKVCTVCNSRVRFA